MHFVLKKKKKSLTIKKKPYKSKLTTLEEEVEQVCKKHLGFSTVSTWSSYP